MKGFFTKIQGMTKILLHLVIYVFLHAQLIAAPFINESGPGGINKWATGEGLTPDQVSNDITTYFQLNPHLSNNALSNSKIANDTDKKLYREYVAKNNTHCGSSIDPYITALRNEANANAKCAMAQYQYIRQNIIQYYVNIIQERSRQIQDLLDELYRMHILAQESLTREAVTEDQLQQLNANFDVMVRANATLQQIIQERDAQMRELNAYLTRIMP